MRKRGKWSGRGKWDAGGLKIVIVLFISHTALQPHNVPYSILTLNIRPPPSLQMHLPIHGSLDLAELLDTIRLGQGRSLWDDDDDEGASVRWPVQRRRRWSSSSALRCDTRL